MTIIIMTVISVGKDAEKLEPVYIFGGLLISVATLENNCGGPQNGKHRDIT